MTSCYWRIPELQTMVDEVCRFTSEWRLSLNLKKSKVMVVRPNGPGTVLGEGEQWNFRGEPLETVQEYKYLGVLITDKLLWAQHIKSVVARGKGSLQPLRRLFAQRQLPMKIKRLAYTSLVRSTMEHASQVWYTNSEQEKALESVQHQAATWILRTNKKSSCAALRIILGLPRLSARRDMMRLLYAGILLTKSPNIWPRHCFETPPSELNQILGISQTH